MGKAIVEPTGDKTCPECGKGFFVQYPSMWTYARREGPKTKYFCSYSCVRKYDKKKGEKKVGKRKMTKEQEKEAVRIALDGGDPLTFLEKCGINNPTQKWYDIKYAVKDSDPETYAKLPLRIQRKKEDKEPEVSLADAMAGMQEAADMFFGACEDMGLKMETPEKPLPVQDLKLQPGGNYRISVETPEAPKIYKPVVYDGMTIREVEGGFGRYRRSDIKDSIYIDFEYAEGLDVMSLTVDQWRGFRAEQMKAAMILGVEL